MSKTVSSESVNAFEAVQNGPGEIAEWQEGVRNFFGKTLAELRDLIETIESHVQHEAETQSESGLGMSLELIAAGPKHGEPIAKLHPRDAATGTDNSEQRLAQLARRLEDKLERSSSREND